MKQADISLDLLDPEQAISSYLDGLFTEEAARDTTNTAQLAAVSANPVAARIQSEALSQLFSAAPLLATADDPPTSTDTVGPYQSSIPMQVILLELAGLKLALPLHELNGILRHPPKLSQIPCSAPWVLGVHATGGRNIQVVDSTALLLPERYRQENHGGMDRTQHLIVLIGNGEWGLDCLAASNVIELQPEQVNWRPDRSRRPWLAGTVREHLCALLDTSAFVSWLERGAPGD